MSCLHPVRAEEALSAIVSWEPSPSSGVVAYKLYLSDPENTRAFLVEAGPVTVATLPLLREDTTYVLTVTAVDSYGLESDPTSNLVFTTPRLPVITWNDPPDMIYGERLGPAQLNATSDIAGSFVYSPPEGTLPLAGNGQVLVAVFTPADPVVYIPREKRVRINVLRAPLVVRADDLQTVFGGPMPELTVTFEGFVNGETLATSGVTGTPALSAGANALSPVGTYPIWVGLGSLTAENYTFHLVGGTLTILPIDPTDQGAPRELSLATENTESCTLRFLGDPGVRYTVVVCEDIAAGGWRRLAQQPRIVGTSIPAVFEVTLPVEGRARFFTVIRGGAE